MALEVGIVGLPARGRRRSSPRSRAPAAAGSARRTSAWRRSPTPRLPQLAELVGARKVTPATLRVVDVPGTGPALLGGLRQVDALLAVADGFSAGSDPAADLETLELELLVADRDHVERRLERVQKQAKSGDAALRQEVEALDGAARSPRGRRVRCATFRASSRRSSSR